jgi:flagellar biosynthetic protein FliR
MPIPPASVLPWLADPLVAAGTLTRMVAAVSVGAVPLATMLPWRMRLALAVLLAAAAVPLAATACPGGLAGQPAPLVLGCEAVVGGAIGLAVAAVCAAAGWAGRLVGSVAGLSWAEDFTPGAVDEEPGTARLAWWLGMGGFLAAGGHLAVVGGLIDSVRGLPVGVGCGAEGDVAVEALVIRLPALAVDLAAAVGAAALAAGVTFHVGAAVCLRTVRCLPGTGMLQGLAALVVLVALVLGADAWCGGYGALARGRVEQTLRLEFGLRP